MAEKTPIFLLDEDEQQIATEPLYISSDESEYSTPNRTPAHYPESIYLDSHNAINQLIASQLEQRSNIGTATVFCPPTSNTSMISDDDEQHSPTPKIGTAAHYMSHFLQRCNDPIALCQQLQPIPDTPEAPPQEIKVKKTFSVPTT